MPDIFTSPATPGTGPATPPATPTRPPVTAAALPARPQGHSLAAYMYMPQGVRFETQEPSETIILLLRKHFITNVPWVALSVVLLFIPFVLFPFFVSQGVISPEIPQRFITSLVFIWYLFTFSYILVNFLLWYFTVSIVTDERIIDIDFDNIISKKFAATRIARVEDVTLRAGGFIRALFNYGDVVVQTAASDVEFIFAAVPHPDRVVRIINQLMGKEEEQGETEGSP